MLGCLYLSNFDHNMSEVKENSLHLNFLLLPTLSLDIWFYASGLIPFSLSLCLEFM